MIEIGAYTPQVARDIKNKVLNDDKSLKSQYANKERNSLRWHYMRLLEDLNAATDELTGYTQARAEVLMYVEGIDSLDMEVITGTENEQEVTNRSTTNSAKAGDILLFKFFIKEWAPVWGGSSSSGSGGTCPCSCIESGDLIHNGVETSSKQTVTLPEQVFKQVNGSIILPTGTFTMVYNPSSSIWELDIGAELIAKYNDGSSATADTTMDGELTLTVGVGTQPELKLCVTGTVPSP